MMRPTHGGNLAWAATVADCSPASILDFSASINPLGPPSSAIRAIKSGLTDLVAYPDPSYYQLREALRKVHPTLTPDWIFPGNGSAELLTWAARELSQLGETAILTPAFSDYQRALKAFDANVRGYSLFGEGEVDSGFCFPLSTSALLDKLSGGGLLLNNPHNPTGLLFNRETLLPLLDKFALVVVDEAFMDFIPPNQDQSLIPLVQDYPNLVILRSLTKFYSLPGLRLGYCVTYPDRLRRWQEWRDPWPVNVLAEAAGIAVLQDTEFQEETWAWLPTARSQLFAGLSQLPGFHPYPSAANFLLVRYEGSCSQLQERLLKEKRILIRDCLSFPELGDRYFRVAVRREEDNQRLLEGLSLVVGY
ncbi:threonine-phosphate decarboxylase CobD [Limnofasciculus baicalensis]|uniref:threonine-phosphate decarboxylase n=1 Tax=Limnofasciculus baicalensis BBK-W-15 TaxID=2699891 RepID=A0AAE3KR62_9CYAN|nr:threonine-phosphate decarboxylase CobD [Limnofasciculus baicalensis]MCP2732526.1 threonine-phosphate decarboxylase CobD [Limnofasciculus baicalensis BBK-W-15]